MEQVPKRPDNYLALAIISTILCCLPAGIVSIVYSTKVNSLYDDAKYEEAERASNNAKIWGIVSVAIALVGWIIYILFFGVVIFAAMSNADF